MTGIDLREDATCHRCGELLRPLVLGAGPDRVEGGYVDALTVQLDGGYGAFLDPMGLDDLKALRYVLCHGCAHEVLKFAGIDWRDEHTCHPSQS